MKLKVCLVCRKKSDGILAKQAPIYIYIYHHDHTGIKS